MKTISQKKAISEIVSYVLLVIIAVTISIFVFAFLKLYVPKDKPECKEGINLIIESAACTYGDGNSKLTLTLQNRGLFKIDQAFIKIGKPNQQVRLSVGSDRPYPLITIKEGATSPGLDPSQSFTISDISLPENIVGSEGDYILEVQPAHYTKGTDIESLALCKSVTQTVNCQK